MKTYPKIDSLFNRDPETFSVIEGNWRRPEFAIVDAWTITEKVDGTSIRIQFNRTPDPATDGREHLYSVEVGGRTDKAQMQPMITAVLREVVGRAIDGAVQSLMSEHSLSSLTLFGEGYGAKIQKVGARYRPDNGFTLFDVLVNDSAWLDEDKVTEVASRLDVERVPCLLLGSGSRVWQTREVINLIKSGDMRSLVSSDEDFEPEGVVAKAAVPLFNARGERVMWKLKHSDFRKGRR